MDLVEAETLGIAGIIGKTGKGLGVVIKAIESRIRTDPNGPGHVLGESSHHVIAQATGVIGVVLEGRE